MAKDALFEIGLEELPARFIDDAQQQLAVMTETFLYNQRIAYHSVESFSTPRRLSVLIHDMAETQTTIEEEVKGPAEHIARDEEGNWTKAAVGFTKGQGLSVDDIFVRDVKGTPYIYVNKTIQGRPTYDLLSEFKTIIESIQFNKSMRWGEETMRYGRPIRWLVALYGSEVVPFEITGIKTGNRTYGHRFLGSEIDLTQPAEYVSALQEQYVIVIPKKREAMITDQISRLQTQDVHIPVDGELLDEVRNLVEYPTVFKGAFDASYLQLPPDVLIISMKEHQRYFPVTSQDGKLLPYFIGVRNGDDHRLDTVIKGNEKVLNARLQDARFFYEEDQKTPLSVHLEKLERVVFQEKLGTLADKVARVEHISSKLAEFIQLDGNQKADVKRAAALSKFDLMTQMVNEFTELQGIMGEDYALKYGESTQVARALREHYMPKGANDSLPKSIEGAILSIADKLDTITGTIAAGMKPSSSQDPYGLRRQATAILRILEHEGWPVEVESLLNIAIDVYDSVDLDNFDKHKVYLDIIDFFHTRAGYTLRDHNIEPDIIQAVIHEKIGIYPYTIKKARLLGDKRHNATFKQSQEALVRVLNISKKAESNAIDPHHFKTESEVALYHAYKNAYPLFKEADSKMDASLALQHLVEMAEPIHRFFEHNMVMSDEADTRNNRLALLNAIAELIFNYADLSAIEWKQQF